MSTSSRMLLLNVIIYSAHFKLWRLKKAMTSTTQRKYSSIIHQVVMLSLKEQTDFSVLEFSSANKMNPFTDLIC